MHAMSGDFTRALRYVRSWLTGRARVVTREVEVDRGDRSIPGTLVLPEGRRASLPAWVVLHGITRPGREHPELVRFVEAVAQTGAAVLVPEVPEWRALDLAPGTTSPTLQGALDALARQPETAGERAGVIGFSFGAPQAVAASSGPTLRGRVAGVVGFGGYCDVARTFRFQLTGHHEWRGHRRHLRPDPYGRWIVGANYLPHVRGHGDAEDVARALHRLAAEAGDRRVAAWDPVYEPLKARLRAEVASSRRELFDLFARPGGGDPTPEEAEPMVQKLAETVARVAPTLDPTPRLEGVHVPVQLLHGRGDRLIPFTESLRLEERLPDDVSSRVTVTGLFAHSQGDPVGSPLRRLWEGVVFLNALRRVLGTV